MGYSKQKPYHPETGRPKKKKRDFQKVQTVLKSALKRFGLEDEFSRHSFVLHWEEIVGKELAKRTQPECIKNKALIIRVKNAIWAQELSFHKEVILTRLQKFLGQDDIVDDVLFYTGDVNTNYS